MSWQEPHEVQQWEVRSLAPGKDKSHAPIYAGGNPAGKQLRRKGPRGPFGHQAAHEPTTCPWYKEG